ncbi:hypothetical protein [Compostimonas suwonensis]|uniref:Transcriptional regulator, AbiEi antitoxin, Type IV TA system n=1 Tax=Compostimonas suwonensis TaxID=1048394 RepID=A0A2M9BV81_9MICO|nr:hypothetical protein [Compostimonas suwonensis]PJJ61859.1 hypothetical protein CLV54_1646 [Compostimonas suwonensis]
MTNDWKTLLERRDGLLLWRDAHEHGRHGELPRALVTGDLRRVTRGVYAPAEPASADADARYRTLVRAVDAARGHRDILARFSAAAVWRLPMLGSWPTAVHIDGPDASGGRSTSRVTYRFHADAAHDATVIDGLRVTSAARTVVSVSRLHDFAGGVAMADRALRNQLVTREALVDELGRHGPARGVRRARAVLEFADPGAYNAGESLARVLMHQLGFDPPELQHPVHDADGLIGEVDFFWPELGLVVEFDGFQKYSRPEYLQGRTPAEVVWAEKLREDRLRALGLRVIRIVWSDLLSPERLRLLLERAGLRRRRA